MPAAPSLLFSILSIGIGAALGAVLRWLLALKLNTLLIAVPLGTLAANLAGGYLIGVALGVFGAFDSLPPEWRLFVITGFLGGLTTFSTFSAEVVSHLHDGRFGWAFLLIAAHVLGSIGMTLAGFATVGALQK
jgi:CrcB protein